MNLARKNLSIFLLFLALGIIIGSLAWEVFERLLFLGGVDLSLTTPDSIHLFDLYVISLSIRANPGILLGAIGGFILFKRS